MALDILALQRIGTDRRSSSMTPDLSVALRAFQSAFSLDTYNLADAHRLPFVFPAEEDLAGALPIFAALPLEAQQNIRSSVDIDLCAKLLTFALRMATYAVRRRTETYIRSGLLGLTLDDDVADYRDVTRVLCALRDGSCRLCVNFESIF